MLGKRSPDLLGRSYQLIGLGLYEKFDRGLQLLRQVIDDGNIKDGVTKEAVSTRGCLNLLPSVNQPKLSTIEGHHCANELIIIH